MGQFKPMVKMETTEPSVILKLKKGGHVNKKAAAKSEHGHKPMHKYDGGAMDVLARTPAMVGRPAVNAPVRVPAKPSLAARRRAMAAMPTPVMKEGGKADIAQDKAMIKKAMKQHDMQEHKGGKGTKLKLKTGGVAEYAKTKMHEAHKDKAHGTGAVVEGKPGGYKHGGKVHHKARGGSMADEKTYGSPVTTEVHQAKHDTAHGTGGVRMGNAGGFKHGGKAHRKAKGGLSYVDGNVTTAHPGVTNTKTGAVVEGKPGGFKKGGAAKKYADGGRVDSGRAVKMPQGHKKPSPPVAINELSGTFKKGGHVKHKFIGGAMPPRSVTVQKESVTTDVPTAAEAEKMRKEIQEKRMDRNTDKGYKNFMDKLRVQKKGGMCWGGKAK